MCIYIYMCVCIPKPVNPHIAQARRQQAPPTPGTRCKGRMCGRTPRGRAPTTLDSRRASTCLAWRNRGRGRGGGSHRRAGETWRPETLNLWNQSCIVSTVTLNTNPRIKTAETSNANHPEWPNADFIGRSRAGRKRSRCTLAPNVQ